MKTIFPRHKRLVFENKNSLFDFQTLNDSFLLILSFIGQQCFLNLNPQKNISIIGYTDNIGTEEYNLKLSENSAKNVANYFISKGINENRINYYDLGESNPIADNRTEIGRIKNRRVEIIID